MAAYDNIRCAYRYSCSLLYSVLFIFLLLVLFLCLFVVFVFFLNGILQVLLNAETLCIWSLFVVRSATMILNDVRIVNGTYITTRLHCVYFVCLSLPERWERFGFEPWEQTTKPKSTKFLSRNIYQTVRLDVSRLIWRVHLICTQHVNIDTIRINIVHFKYRIPIMIATLYDRMIDILYLSVSSEINATIVNIIQGALRKR